MEPGAGVEGSEVYVPMEDSVDSVDSGVLFMVFLYGCGRPGWRGSRRCSQERIYRPRIGCGVFDVRR
ncbi:hypothetical protein GCM10009670_14580 [Citricoccus alkalitolerans]